MENAKIKTNWSYVCFIIILYSIFYITVLSFLYASSGNLLIIYVLFSYIFISISLTYILYKRDIKLLNTNSDIYFNKINPFENTGEITSHFKNVFLSKDKYILEKVKNKIKRNLEKNMPIRSIKDVNLVDKDRLLVEESKKNVLLVRLNETLRETQVVYILNIVSVKNTHSVEWWILNHGGIRMDEVVSFIINAPFSFLLWIWKYVFGNYNIANSVRVKYHSFFDKTEVVNNTLLLSKVSFDSLISTLDKSGLELAEFKAQREEEVKRVLSRNEVSYTDKRKDNKNLLNLVPKIIKSLSSEKDDRY